jgi:hypothetical protein
MPTFSRPIRLAREFCHGSRRRIVTIFRTEHRCVITYGAFGHFKMWRARGGVCDGDARVLRGGWRVDASGSLATCKDATLTLDTALAGRRDALNPAELLLAALSACMIKGIERVAPMLKFSLRGVEIRVQASERTSRRGWNASTTRSSWTRTSPTGAWSCYTTT